MIDQPIIAQIQPECEAFSMKVRDAKKAQGKTNQEVSDATGIPLSNIGKFFSGNLTNPNIYNAVAVCIYLGISIDEAFGLQAHQHDGSQKRIEELEEKIRELKIHLEYAEKDKQNLHASLKGRKLIIAVLFGLCILLTACFGFGIIYDSIVQDAGFIQGGNIAPISILCITAVVIAIAVTIVLIANHIYKKEKR